MAAAIVTRPADSARPASGINRLAFRLDVLEAARLLEIPYLVVHGTEDEAVPVSEAEALAAAAGELATLSLIDGAGYTMNAEHPFEGSNHELERAIDLTAGHLGANLPERGV